MRTSIRMKAACVAALALRAQCAGADTTFCVGDIHALREALALWTTTPSGTVTIAMSRGIYAVDSAAGETLGMFTATGAASLRLLGGYDAGCTQRVLDARNTVIDGRNESTARLRLSDVRADVLFEGLTFTRLPGGIDVVHDFNTVATGHRLRLAHSRIVNNDTRLGSGSPAYTMRLWGVGSGSGAEVAIENSVIANNVNLGFSLSSALSTGSGGRVVLTGSTVANNRVEIGASGIVLQTFVAPAITFVVMNNIAWGNGTPGFSYDIDVSSAQTPAVTYTLVGAINGVIGPTATNLALEPRFLSATAGNFRLSPLSPALDAGNGAQAALPPVDVDGQSRVAGDNVDMGAYEAAPGDLIFYSDFGG